MGDQPGTAIVWFRNDLRLTDQEPLTAACASLPKALLPILCLEPASLGHRSNLDAQLNTPQLGPHLARFLLESIQALDHQLQELGSGLFAAFQDTASLMSEVVKAVAVTSKVVQLFYHFHVGFESEEREQRVAEAFTAAASDAGIQSKVHAFWGSTLYHPDDLPYSVWKGSSPGRPAGSTTGQLQSHIRKHLQSLPGVMTDFRKAVELHGHMREPIPTPTRLPPLPAHLPDAHPLPSTVPGLYAAAEALDQLHALEQLCGATLGGPERDPRTAVPWPGGAVQGQQRLREFLGSTGASSRRQEVASAWPGRGPNARPTGHEDQEILLEQQGAPILDFKATRMMAGGIDNSLKLSAYLARGCLSPRQVFAELEPLLAEGGAAAEGAACLRMHLIIRDFFIFTAIKAGPAVLHLEGLAGKHRPWRQDAELFGRWARGETGFPFVDACMRELAHTGYMSNRGRQNVASFLAKELQLDWRLGAQLFESLLVDHDFAVNYVNWNYFAGVGNDPRDRKFSTIHQGLKYDPEAQLIKSWIPALEEVLPEYAHRPWTASEDLQASIREKYPPPIVEPALHDL